MKDLRWLALFILMALLVSCDLRAASAPPLVVNLPSATSAPKAQPQVIAPESPKRFVPPGLRVDAGIPALVTDRWYALAYMYPDVAKRITRIAARRLPKGWIISYEARTIYVNTWYGDYVVADKLTEQFARRAYDELRKRQPNAAKSFRTAKRFAAWLRTGVR